MKNETIYKLLISLVFGFIISLSSINCNKSSAPDCLKSTGSIEKIERQVEAFHSIKLYDNVNLHLIPSGGNKLILESGKNLMDKIETYVNEDSTLIIKNNNSCNWVRSYNKPITVYLDVSELRRIEYRSIGNITNTDTLRMDSLTIDVWEGAGKIELAMNTKNCWANIHYGTADIVLHGRADQGFYYLLGAGKIDASGLEVGLAYLRNWSSNNLYLWATKHMSVEIKGLGNVYYKGNPGISSNIFGEGKLIKME